MNVIDIEGLEVVVAPDGCSVREIARPPSGARNQSLAEATVEPGAETVQHLHRLSEEIYLFVSGSGRMQLGGDQFEVGAGQVVVIPPGTAHRMWNTGREPLILFCCCSPPYSDLDTVLLEG